MNGDQVLQIGQALAYVVAAIFGAFVGVGFTAGAFVVFVRAIMNSPAVVVLLEGIVNSFPAETRELINLLGQLVTQLSDGVPTVEAKPLEEEAD